MDESLASDEPVEEPVEEETEETEEVVEEQDETKEQVKNLNRAFAEMRRENKRLREEVDSLRKPKAEEKEEEFPVDDEAYLKAGDVKKLVKFYNKSAAPKQDRTVLADTLNASEQLAMLRHDDYAEVVEEFRAELDDDPSLQAFIIGTPGTHMNAGERLYQFALMRRGQNDGGSRKETIEAVVNKKKKPATMGLSSKKTGSTAFSPVGKTLDEIRAFKKKNPDAYEKAMGGA
jgi:hypothetical protein